jgi:VRR-NUC domain
MRAYRPEQQIQRSVFAHLAARPAAGVFAFHCPNGGWRSPVEAAIMKGLGVVAGIPDLLAIRAGQVFALELKAPGGRVRDAQRDTMAALQAAGAICAVADDLDSAIARLEEWGLLRGRASLRRESATADDWPATRCSARARAAQRRDHPPG